MGANSNVYRSYRGKNGICGTFYPPSSSPNTEQGNVKDLAPFIKKHYIIYRLVCATQSCNEDSVGECARRLYEHVKYHNCRGHSSHLAEHAGETGHLPVDTANFEVIGSGYHQI